MVSDFLPSRGSSQFIARPLVTAGYRLDSEPHTPLPPDDVGTTKTVGDMTATLTYQPARFWAEVESELTLNLTDTATGEAVTDLQTYLGSFGHAFIMSEDMMDYVHTHPMPLLPADADLESLRGGPSVSFQAFMPKARPL